MHISLGVSADVFPIQRFLDAGKRNSVTVRTAPQRRRHPAGTLTFGTNPNRRGGEWDIRDQFTHRHPAWSNKFGFPSSYDRDNPPYIFVFRIDDVFHVRFSTERTLLSFGLDVPEPILNERKGILPTNPALLRRFHLEGKSTVETYRGELRDLAPPPFDPDNIEDGRRRIFREISSRQGQQAFRRKLIKAYNTRCAITEEQTEWVLEAAHITPYMGTKTNAVSNGLLLRADIHTLFDLALISVHPEERTVKVSQALSRTNYFRFHDKRLAEPVTDSARPSTAALREHFSGFLP